MPLRASADFGARMFEGADQLSIHNHLFAAANTALPFLRHDAPTLRAEQAFLAGVARVDIFGAEERRHDRRRAHCAAAARRCRRFDPGASYLLETVVRTLKVGHPFSQGTADSNEIWLEVTASSGGRVDRQERRARGGQRRSERALHQRLHAGPRGAPGRSAQRAGHLRSALRSPDSAERRGRGPLRVHGAGGPDGADRQSRSSCSTASSRATSPRTHWGPARRSCRSRRSRRTTSRSRLPACLAETAAQASPVNAWERWNDYGIGLLLEGSTGSEKGELRQAADAFTEVERFGRPDGAAEPGPRLLQGRAARRHRRRAAARVGGRRAAVDGRVAERPGQQGERLSRPGDRRLRARARHRPVRSRSAAIRFQRRLRGHQRARSGAVRTGQGRARTVSGSRATPGSCGRRPRSSSARSSSTPKT